MLEIKCSYKYRDDLPTSKAALSDRAYFLEKDASTEEIHLSKSHKYYYQVQGQVSICGVGYCDFVCWSQKGLYVERVMKDDEFPSRVFPALKKFFCKYILPELLTRKLKHASRSCDSEEVNEELYCICHKPESGRMIACDNSNCSIKWFHYGCVGIKRAPRGKWYCSSNCKQSTS